MVSFYRDLITHSIGVPYVAGLYRQYIHQSLESSQFKVVTYRLEAISDLVHLHQFIKEANLTNSPGFNLNDALKCLIMCSGNPSTVSRTIENFIKTKNRRVCPEQNDSGISLSDPLIQAFDVEAFPLALSSQLS
ncbi:hypothetical protein GEMRC1_009869 [Eukaryota sp. GEM-RC1]